MPFLLALPVVFVAVGLLGALLERLLYRRLYRRSPPRSGAVHHRPRVHGRRAPRPGCGGRRSNRCALPGFLRGQITLLGIDLGAYRLFLVALVIAVSAGLGLLMSRTRFGAQLRAAVDNRQAAVGVGVNVGLLFGATFALGSALAGSAARWRSTCLGLDPTFALKYLVYFLVVVVVGGAGSLKGSLVAAVLLGVVDVAGKYYVPQIGSFIIYAAMVALLIFFPAGLHGRRA